MRNDADITPAEHLTNPQFTPSGKSQPIGDSDFTNGTNDISKRAKETLGSYMSKLTKGKGSPYYSHSHGNVYEINDVVSLPENVGHRGTELEDASINDQQIFLKNDIEKSTLQSSGLGVHKKGMPSSQSTFFEASQLKGIIDKTGQRKELNGHSLLQSVPADGNIFANRPDGDTRGIAVLQAIHDQLVAGNMFSNDASVSNNAQPFVKNANSTNEETATRGLFTIQRDIGKFDKDGKVVKVSDMSKLAMAMMLKVAGSDNSADQMLSSDLSTGPPNLSVLSDFLNPVRAGTKGLPASSNRFNSLNSELAKTASGQNDFMIQIQSDENLLSHGTTQTGENIPRLQTTSKNKTSYAQMNSFLEPFGGKFSSAGMVNSAAQSMLTIMGAALALQGLIGNAGGKLPDRDPQQPSTLQYGKRTAIKNALLGSLLHVFQAADTDYDFGDCVSLGLAILYGFSGQDSQDVTSMLKNAPAAALLTIAENLAMSAGYYANFTRNIIQGGLEFVNAFSKVNSGIIAGSGFDIDEFSRSIENLTSSKIYKIVMIAAGLGDIALRSKNGMLGVPDTARMLSHEQQRVFSPDDLQPKIDENFSMTGGAGLGIVRQQISRWGDGSNPLSLKTYLATQVIIGDGKTATIGHQRGLSPSRERVEIIENALEAEYMPFYIHDLRTHEIMSMPAFITEFNETFTANYNVVKGIGRQDPVRLYQDTERAVTIGFVLAAMNEDDHQHLWLTINKFVAMCYPQYSAGRLREIDNGDDTKTQFIQPFSQVQAASPMVRLRLGDVFKSNYSKFGLSRLFGMGSSQLNASVEKTNTSTTSTLTELRDKEKIEIKRIEDKIRQDFRNAMDSGFNVGDEIDIDAGATVNLIGVAQTKTLSKKETVSVIIDKNDRIRVSNGNVVYEVDKNETHYYSESTVKKKIDTSDEILKIRNDIKNLQTSLPDDKFFKSSNNAIVRSFESTRGRGIAGFITSLSLNYDEKFPWEITPGMRAPKIVKITMGFVPITDLPLGLDYDGSMRNPSHPVGRLAGSFGDVYTDSVESISMGNVQNKIGDNNRSTVEYNKIIDLLHPDVTSGEINGLSNKVNKFKGKL